MALILLLTACLSQPDALSRAEVTEASEKAAGVEPDDLLQSVERLLLAHATETPQTFDGVPYRREAGGQWVFDQFQAMGLQTWKEEADLDSDHPIVNVLAELPGASDEVVYVSAHHDVWYLPADDNTSGVAALLAVAEALKDEPLDRTVRLASFDQEETGLLGSTHHYLNTDRSKIVAVINMDPIGYANRTKGSQSSPPGFSTPDVADFLAVIGNAGSEDLLGWSVQLGPELPHPLHVIAVHGVGDNTWPLLGDLHRSDHNRAWLSDIPGALLTDTTNFRNPHYHTDHDAIHTLDPDFFAGSTQLSIALTWAAQAKR